MINPINIIGNKGNSHIWNFSRVGGVNRVNLETGLDLISLEHLDQKLWTALSCPVYGLEIDFRTLQLVDTDKDDRIRVPEIIEAVKWITALLKDPDDLVKDNKILPLSAINDSTEQGKILLESARQILKNLGKPDATEITVDETSDTTKIFAGTKFNGDGVITEDSADEDYLKTIITEIISCIGSIADRSGKEGVGLAHIADFYNSCEAFSAWNGKAEANLKQIMPFGDSTAQALTAYNVVKKKIEDYFLRHRLSEFNHESAAILNSLDERYEALKNKELSFCIEDIAALPLASAKENGILSLTRGINPVWEKAITEFYKLVIEKLFPGKDSLKEDDMNLINDTFSPYLAWLSEKAGSEVEKLGLARVREICAGKTKDELISLVDKDMALETNANNIFMVDKLVRYYRDLHTLLNNYVTFFDFYSPGKESIFQAGKLYIDQRCCDLCIRVSDMAKHNTLARSSGLCLIYCECLSRSRNEKMTIVAALTDGDFYNIDVGRNAIFYDRKGNDWDATIIKIVDNPISIRQAFWSPYRKVSKFINNQIEKVATAKEKEVDSMAASGVEKTSGKVDAGIKESIQAPQGAQTKTAAPVQPFDIGKFVGIFAALSLALGAIGSVIASALTGFLGLAWWKMPLALLGIILAISGPSMILAWLKLRKRNLAPVLDANGWAINARATINIAFGNTLTHIASLPPNAKLNLVDPFSKKKNPFFPILISTIIILGLIGFILWHFGFLSKWGIL